MYCTLGEKNRGNLNVNEYLLMGWSERHLSLVSVCQRYMTFTSPNQQIFIVKLVQYFFLKCSRYLSIRISYHSLK